VPRAVVPVTHELAFAKPRAGADVLYGWRPDTRYGAGESSPGSADVRGQSEDWSRWWSGPPKANLPLALTCVVFRENVTRRETLDITELAALTQVFLIPSTILVGALGVARTEGLKTGISHLGLLTTVVWLVGFMAAPAPDSGAIGLTRAIRGLAIVFFIGWGVATLVHWSAYVRELAEAERLLASFRGALTDSDKDLPESRLPVDVRDSLPTLISARILERTGDGQYREAASPRRLWRFYFRSLRPSAFSQDIAPSGLPASGRKRGRAHWS
jgi:hypothetical protein